MSSTITRGVLAANPAPTARPAQRAYRPDDCQDTPSGPELAGPAANEASGNKGEVASPPPSGAVAGAVGARCSGGSASGSGPENTRRSLVRDTGNRPLNRSDNV